MLSLPSPTKCVLTVRPGVPTYRAHGAVLTVMLGAEVAHVYVPEVPAGADYFPPTIHRGTAWTVHFTDGATGNYVYTGPAVEEHRQAWAVHDMSARHYGRPVFSVSPEGCTGIDRNCHFGNYCPIHPNA